MLQQNDWVSVSRAFQFGRLEINVRLCLRFKSIHVEHVYA